MRVSAPGKLMLAGEWSVLELGNPCIVLSVNKRVYVEIEECKEISVTVDDFNIKECKASFADGKLVWLSANDEEKEKLIFMKGAIETALQYLGFKDMSGGFKIRSWGEESQIEVNGEFKKIGLSKKKILLPRFHPDGKRINFMTFKSNEEIWVMENFLSE